MVAKCAAVLDPLLPDCASWAGGQIHVSWHRCNCGHYGVRVCFSFGVVVVVVGVHDFYPHWNGSERGSDPSTPLLTTAQSWG